MAVPCLDHLFTEIYEPETNNCRHFVARAWPIVTGGDQRLAELSGEVWQARGIMRRFREVPGPTVSPSVVLLDTLEGDLHMGICFDRRLLDLSAAGVRCLLFEVYQHQYRDVRFYQ